MQKKAKAPEPAGESAPMWIVSFADLVTLMMSFFVVLYALKQGGEKQQLEVAANIRYVFDPNYLPPADSTSEFDQMIRALHGVPGPPFPNNGGHVIDPNDGAKGPDTSVTTIRTGKEIVSGTKITFDKNGTDLDPASLAAIGEIFKSLQGHNNVLFIKGHVSTDELVLRPDDPDGRDLSYERAKKVADALQKLGIDRRVMRPLACGANEPVKTAAYDPQLQRLNRRVEVFSTDATAAQFDPVPTVEATDQGPAVGIGALPQPSGENK